MSSWVIGHKMAVSEAEGEKTEEGEGNKLCYKVFQARLCMGISL